MQQQLGEESQFIFTQMKTRVILSALLSTIVFLQACQKDEPTSNGNKSLTDITAPEGFTYEANENLTIQFNLIAPDNKPRTVKILDAQYRTLAARTVQANSGKIELRTAGTYEDFFIYVPNDNVIHPFSRNGQANVTVSVNLGKRALGMINTLVAPTIDCSSAATPAVNSFQMTTASYTLANYTGSVDMANVGMTLDICGNVTLSSAPNAWNNTQRTIRIAEGATLTINSKSLIERIKIINLGTLNMPMGMDAGNEIINFGTINVAPIIVVERPRLEPTNFNSGSNFINLGTLNAAQDLSLNGNAAFTNEGTIIVDRDLNLNNNANFENQCKVLVGRNLNVNQVSSNTNAGYIAAEGNLSLNNNSFFAFNGSSAVLHVEEISNYQGTAYMTASGGTALLKVENEFKSGNGSWSGSHSGLIEVCVGGTISGNRANNMPATFNVGCNLFLPASPCQPIQFGVPTAIDADGDGVAEGIDVDDNDASIAYLEAADYFTVNSFEDLWPSKGDYDFNDLVIKHKANVYRNANNNIARIDYQFLIQALGAGLPNGLGLQFLRPNTNGSNGYESIPSQLVIGASNGFTVAGTNFVELASNVRNLQSAYYTNVGAGPIALPDTLNFSVNFDFNATQPALILSDFFIFRTTDVALEVHLPNRPPSTRGLSTGFGTKDDDSDAAAGKWYLTSNNLPWGLEIVENNITFKHPKSKVRIDDAYPDFLDWVLSNGTAKKNWAQNPNINNVFFFPN